jgi:hypothetical protein
MAKTEGRFVIAVETLAKPSRRTLKAEDFFMSSDDFTVADWKPKAFSSGTDFFDRRRGIWVGELIFGHSALRKVAGHGNTANGVDLPGAARVSPRALQVQLLATLCA